MSPSSAVIQPEDEPEESMTRIFAAAVVAVTAATVATRIDLAAGQVGAGPRIEITIATRMRWGS